MTRTVKYISRILLISVLAVPLSLYAQLTPPPAPPPSIDEFQPADTSTCGNSSGRAGGCSCLTSNQCASGNCQGGTCTSGGSSGGGSGGGSGTGSSGSGSCSAGELCNPIKAGTFADLIQAIANAVTAIGIPLVAIFLIYSGFLFVTAGGNEQQLEKAKITFKWSLIGGVIVIGAYAIATAIVNFAKMLG